MQCKVVLRWPGESMLYIENAVCVLYNIYTIHQLDMVKMKWNSILLVIASFYIHTMHYPPLPPHTHIHISTDVLFPPGDFNCVVPSALCGGVHP